MRVLVVLAALSSVVCGGFVPYHHTLSGHHLENDDGHKATSFQSIHIEHFHPVPVFLKKDHPHLAEHPIPKGKSISNVKINHGSKHDVGYAIITNSNDIHGNDHQGSHESSIFVSGGGGGGGHSEITNSHEHFNFHEALGGQEVHEELSNESLGVGGGYEVHDNHEYPKYHGGTSQSQEQEHEQISLGHEDYLNHYNLASGDSHLIEEGYGGHQDSYSGGSEGLGAYGNS